MLPKLGSGFPAARISHPWWHSPGPLPRSSPELGGFLTLLILYCSSKTKESKGKSYTVQRNLKWELPIILITELLLCSFRLEKYQSSVVDQTLSPTPTAGREPQNTPHLWVAHWEGTALLSVGQVYYHCITQILMDAHCEPEVILIPCPSLLEDVCFLLTCIYVNLI